MELQSLKTQMLNVENADADVKRSVSIDSSLLIGLQYINAAISF